MPLSSDLLGARLVDFGDEQPPLGGRGEHGAHVEDPGPVGGEGDGDRGGGPNSISRSPSTATVPRSTATVCGSPGRSGRASRIPIGTITPGAIGASTVRAASSGGGQPDRDPVRVGAGGRVQQPGDAGQADGVRLGERAVDLAQRLRLPQRPGADVRHRGHAHVDQRDLRAGRPGRTSTRSTLAR